MRPRAKIVNETDYDGRTVNSIVRWALKQLDLEKTPVTVKVKYTRRWFGAPVTDWAYSGWFHFAWGGNTITLRVHPERYYPIGNHQYERTGEMPPLFVCADWREALVAVAGHELMHLRQYVTKPARYITTKKGKRRAKSRFVEAECEWAAYRLWRRWREEKGLDSRCRQLHVSRTAHEARSGGLRA